MKNIKQKLLVLAMAGVMSFSALSLAACDNKEKPSVDPKPPITDVDPTPEDPTPEKPTIPTEPYDEFVARMGVNNSYSYTYTQNGVETWYQIDGDKVLIDDYKTYLYLDKGVTYKLTYNEIDKKYHKTISEEALDVESYILDDLQVAELKAYDEDSKEYTVSMSGKTYQMLVSSSSLLLASGGIQHKIEAVDKITVNMPLDRNIVDETGKTPVDPNPPVVDPDDPVVEDKIYTLNAGVRTYNSKLLAETIKEALNTTLQNGNTLFTEISHGAKATVGDILFVSSQGDNIILGTKSNSTIADATFFHIFTIPKSSVEELSDKKQDWIDGLINKKQITARGIKGVDFKKSEENKTQLTEIFEKVLDKYATNGLQPQSKNMLGTPVPRFENSTVVSVFEYAGSQEGSAALDMGYIHHIGLVGVVLDKNGDAVFLNLGVATTDFVSAYDTILNTNNNKNNEFIVFEQKEVTEVDKELYKEETSKARTSAKAKEVALPAGRSKE